MRGLFGLILAIPLVIGCGDSNKANADWDDGEGSSGTAPADPFGDNDTDEPSQPAPAVDDDEDGIPVEEDCDDANANLGAISYDMDCDGVVTNEDCDDTNSVMPLEDGDCDGTPTAEDCDDSNPLITTGRTYFIDYDGDGFGSADIESEVSCEAPFSFVENDGDCDDRDVSVYPGAEESCDEKDNDCDGATDEDVAVTFYLDADGDGYGDSSTTSDRCTLPEGYAERGDDCNDDWAEVHPGAEEICNDGVDNDCDGTAASCTMDPETADLILWGAEAGDEAGSSVSGGLDLNGDGYDDFAFGAKNESTASTQAGAAYVIYGGPAMTETTSIDSVDIFLTGANSLDKAGRVVRIVNDLNDDGLADLVVSAPGADPSGESSGEVYINFSGGDSGSLAEADFIFSGRAYTYAGLGLGHGDFNGDGTGDVLIGSPGADEGGGNTGTIYLLPGPISPGETSAATAEDYITGQSEGDQIGNAIGTLDHNADGIDDLIIGSQDNSEGRTAAGSVYIVHGPIEDVTSLATADLQYMGESAADGLGGAVSSAGDIDGDGNDDFIVGAGYDDDAAPDAGAVYVVSGGLTMGGSIDEYAFVKITGEASSDQFGTHVIGNGDIDNDGNDDIMVSAPFAGGIDDTGSTYIFYGPMVGTVSASDADARFNGSTIGDQFGNAFAFAGDVDGDGNTAILIGASKKDTAGVDAGGVYLMLELGP